MAQTGSDPDVTILMPCLNEAETLAGCIESAKEALDRLAAHDLTGEILVSDNGSDDGSVEIARAHGCRVAQCPVRGYGNAFIYGALLLRAWRGSGAMPS